MTESSWLRRRSSGLWRHPDFVKLWLGQTVSRFGSQIGGTALSLTAVLALAATPVQMGLLAALGAAPVLIAGLFVGVWVDRLHRRPIMIAADAGRALALTSIPLAAALGHLRLAHLYVVAAVVGLLTVFFDVADQSFFPTLVPRERLAEGNSALSASDSIAEISGPAIAGSLVQWLSGPVAILIDAVSFAISAVCLGAIRTVEPRPARLPPQRSAWHEALDGLRLVRADPLLRALAGSAAMSTFFGNFIGALYEIYAIRTLGIPPALAGLLIAAGGVGAFAGALVAGRVTRRFGLGPTLIGAALAGGTLQLLNPLAHGPVAAAAALLMGVQLLGDVAYAIHFINALSLRQALIPDRLMGRVNASWQFLTVGVAPLGALLAGLLGQAIGVRLTLLCGACGIMLASLWLFLSPLRTLREHPVAPTDPALAGYLTGH